MTNREIMVYEMLGYNPYYLACKGLVVAVAASESASPILPIWRSIDGEREASAIGTLCADRGRVILETAIGG